MSLLFQIERHLREAGVPATKFGRLAINDPRLVGDLRNGRELRPRTARRVEAFLASVQGSR